MPNSLRACYFGTYSTGEFYPRNTVIMSALRKAGVEVVECHCPLFSGAEEKRRAAQGLLAPFLLGLRLLVCHLRLTLKFVCLPRVDVVVVGYGGICDVVLARALCVLWRRPVVYDAFISLYDTVVCDRKLCSPNSLKARVMWWYDYLTCRFASLVLLDTEAHIGYFVEEFSLPRDRFARVWVGTDKEGLDAGRDAEPAREGPFQVLFWGTFVPLHGLETIVSAAHELNGSDNISFTIIGNGQLESEIKRLADSRPSSNLRFLPPMSYGDIVPVIHAADVCLGVFGTTDKTQRVIPCKVYESLCFGKPLITGDTPAARELLLHQRDSYLVPCGDSAALADAIRALSQNAQLRDKLAQGARETYLTHCSHAALGNDLIQDLRNLVLRRAKASRPTLSRPGTERAQAGNGEPDSTPVDRKTESRAGKSWEGRPA